MFVNWKERSKSSARKVARNDRGIDEPSVAVDGVRGRCRFAGDRIAQESGASSLLPVAQRVVEILRSVCPAYQSRQATGVGACTSTACDESRDARCFLYGRATYRAVLRTTGLRLGDACDWPSNCYGMASADSFFCVAMWFRR